MIYPEFIKENGCIGVPAPSAGAGDELRQNSMHKAKERLEKLGFKLKLSKNLYNDIRGRSATAIERANEINDMFQSKDIDMLLCASGGEFLIEMLPFVNFELIKSNPKFVAGFSDPTGLLYPITTKYDIATIYGNNFKSFGHDELFKSEKDFLEIIKGNLLEQHSYELFEETPFQKVTGTEPYNLNEKVYWRTLDDKEVSVNGRIIGGCFDIIAELAGTKYDGIKEFNEKYKEDGIIWYFDNCELSMEETIRTLWKLNELDYFKYTKCVIFGRFGVNNSYYDYDVKSCLEDSVLGTINVPIIYDADISHKALSFTIINGSIANVNVKDGKGTISFELK